MKTVTYTPDNFLLKDGEVIVFDNSLPKIGGSVIIGNVNEGKTNNYIEHIGSDKDLERVLSQDQTWKNLYNKAGKVEKVGQFRVVASTRKIEGIPHLQRELFVKPVDVEALSAKRYPCKEYSDLNEINALRCGFIEGYAASNSKGEFTREDMLEAMKYASSHLSSVKGMRQYLDSIRPISLPKSIQVTDNNWNNPKIVW